MTTKLLNSLEEAVCAHQIFRTLGFSPEQLFLNLKENRVGVVIRAQDKEYGLALGQSPCETEAETKAEWLRLILWWNDPEVPDDVRQEFFDRSILHSNHTKLLFGIVSAGLKLPCAIKAENPNMN